MSASGTLANVVLATLRVHGALTRGEILARQPVLGNRVAITNALNRLKAAGLVERANGEGWRVTERGRVEDDQGAAVPVGIEAARQELDAALAAMAPASRETPTPLVPEPEPPSARRTAAPTPRPHDRLVITTPDAAVTATLERFAQAAQNALDEYVYSVGDRRILDRLMAARDAAREALHHHQEGV